MMYMMCDGTSREHKKIVGQQLSLDNNQTLSLGFKTVASEDAITLLEVTFQQLDEMIILYAKHKGEVQNEVFKELISKLTSLMSDRAAVRKRFHKDLADFIQSELGHETMLNFLHCQAHYLLGK